MLPERIAAIMLQGKKLPLVTGDGPDFFWTPGGRVEEGESNEQTLQRELQEELKIELVKMDPYFIYQSTKLLEKVRWCIVTWNGKIIPSSEITKASWYKKEEFEEGNPKVTKGIERNLLPKLVKDGLL